MAANYETSKKTKRGWTKQPNALLRDKDLSSDAFKVITFLLSITGDYNISMKGISKTINLSESKVKRAVDLLQDTGYLKIVKIRNGKLFGGYKWLISDVPGSYRKCADDISMDGISNPTTSMYENSNDGISIYEKSMDAPLYEYTERYEQTNHERRIDEHTEEDEERENQEASLSPFSLPPYNPSSFTESSSVANAPSPTSKNTSSQVITQTDLNIEQAFDRFCDIYPNLGDIDQARAAFFSIPDISNICWEITNSVEWFEENKRWDDWTTGQKNVSCPGAVRFLKEGRWKQYLKSGATISEEERLMTALQKCRQNNNNIFGGTEYYEAN